MTGGRLGRVVRAVKARSKRARGLSDDELRNETARLRSELARGRSLDAIMPEAYAAIAEADRRVLGTYPYDEQIYGAAALQAGCLAEMSTGEGKTLTATMPLYLHALTGRSTIWSLQTSTWPTVTPSRCVPCSRSWG